MAGTSGDEAVACPHCGGAIKPAARLCKHCRRPVDPLENARTLVVRPRLTDQQRASLQAAPHRSAPMAAVTPSPPPLPPMLVDLRRFLASKKLVEPTKVDQLLASRSTDDAAALVRGLATVGLVTQVQAEALVTDFHQRQMTRARAVIDAAQGRGLVPATHVEHAIESYAPMAFTVPIHDHLVGAGLLTREQADLVRRVAAKIKMNRWLAMANGISLLVLLYALVTNTWWSSASFHQGLLGAEACTGRVCESHSYSEVISLLTDYEAGTTPAEDFRSFANWGKATFALGLLLLCVSSCSLVLLLRRSRHAKLAALTTCGVAGLFEFFALVTVHAARSMSGRSATSLSHGAVLAILSAAGLAVAALMLRPSLDG